jgi:hypothetical protein
MNDRSWIVNDCSQTGSMYASKSSIRHLQQSPGFLIGLVPLDQI